ncbi:extracellular solute-binding protein [Conexibacter stalactiti]|uniref:Extracellular solute-binding protein n=1 Tax=Conexibacter stalactiti TaxID=1940611 RepID=A0ABU4HLA7_9ACTN|nr:extracellular solute-binding protein [Conexibacter stalactiti]MDW5594086.1 extracellular solute-binding protein [Conexibacter stalactiti]MEC5034728.1 extracellular solute-binding protein [Conexibacter stalactiti]
MEISAVSRGRRAVLAVALSGLVAAFGACGDDGSSSTSGTAGRTATVADGEKVTGKLTYWFAPTAPAERAWWERFVERFERRHPGAEVDLTTYSTEEYFTKVLAAFTSGDEPDLFHTDTGEYLDKFVRTGKIAALNDLVDRGDYAPASLEPLTAPDGALYGVPDYWYVLAMWDNVDLLAEHGLRPPRTWDELLGVCSVLGAAGVVPIAFGDGGQDQWTAGHWVDTLIYQYGGAKAVADATYGTGGASWSDEPIVEGASRFAELVDADCFPKGFTGMNYTQASALFLRGRAGLTFTGTWFAPQIASEAGDFAVEVTPMPDGPGATRSTASAEGIVGGVSALAATTKATAANPALVAAFLNEFGAEADAYANATDQLSVAADPQPKGGGLQARLTRLLTSVGELGPVTDITVPGMLRDPYLQQVQALSAGDLSPQQFGDAMAEIVERERPNFP